MRIENTMVSGYGKPDEARIYATKDIFGDYIPDPVYRCERCKDTVMPQCMAGMASGSARTA